jgi:hypothetical protein
MPTSRLCQDFFAVREDFSEASRSHLLCGFLLRLLRLCMNRLASTGNLTQRRAGKDAQSQTGTLSSLLLVGQAKSILEEGIVGDFSFHSLESPHPLVVCA